MEQTSIETLKNRILLIKPELREELEKNILKMSHEESYFYLCGCLAGVEGVQTPPVDAIEKAVKRIPTKYTDEVLDYLFINNICYHGDLAKSLKLSESGLTAVMKKISNCEISLIENMREGKYKVYALSKAGKLYVEERRRLSAVQAKTDFSHKANCENQEEQVNDLTEVMIENLEKEIDIFCKKREVEK